LCSNYIDLNESGDDGHMSGVEFPGQHYIKVHQGTYYFKTAAQDS